MLVSPSDQVSDLRDTMTSANGDAESRRTIAILDELLAQSICLRNLYRNARWQTADVQYRRVRQLFDRHYNEQLGLVDVLIDRIQTWDEGSKYLRGTSFREPSSPVRSEGASR